MNESFESERRDDDPDKAFAAGADEAAVREAAESSGGVRRKRPPIWPFVFYFLLVALSIAGVVAVLQLSYHVPHSVRRFAELMLAGGKIGLATLIGVFAGLWGRCWIAGFWTACLLAGAAVIGIAAAQKSLHQQPVETLPEIIPVLFAIPAMLFVLAAPHLLMRRWCGWRLDHWEQPFHRKQPVGLLELLALVSVIASVCFLLRVPLVTWGIRVPAYIAQTISINNVVLFALSMAAAVVAVKFAFRGRTLRQRRILPVAVSLVGFGLFAVAWGAVLPRYWMRWWEWDFLISPVATAIFVGGLRVLKEAGFGLTRNLPAADPRSVSSDVDAGFEPARSRAVHGRWAAATLLGVIVTSVALNVHTSRRHGEVENLAQLAERLRDAGGDLVLKDSRPSRVEIGAGAAGELLAQLSRYDGLTELSLAGSKVDDELLHQLSVWFPNLQSLDLAHTGVSAKGLRHLQPLTGLRSLGLAGTDLTIEEINDIVRELGGLMELDLSDSGLSAEELARLDSSVYQFAVRGLGLTDADLAALQGRVFSKLDISGNPIMGQGLVGLQIIELTAHDVPLTDAGLQAFLSNTNTDTTLQKLTLSSTQLTDAAAPLLLGVENLHLGDGTISEAAVEANATRMNTLGLHSRQFTGECLQVMGPQVTFLDLSGSGITDQALINLGESLRSPTSGPSGLGLADTEITDRGLRAISGRIIRFLDLRRTTVSAEAISQLERTWVSALTVHLDVGQFTPQQLEMLRQHHTIVVGERPGW